MPLCCGISLGPDVTLCDPALLWMPFDAPNTPPAPAMTLMLTGPCSNSNLHETMPQSICRCCRGKKKQHGRAETLLVSWLGECGNAWTHDSRRISASEHKNWYTGLHVAAVVPMPLLKHHHNGQESSQRQAAFLFAKATLHAACSLQQRGRLLSWPCLQQTGTTLHIQTAKCIIAIPRVCTWRPFSLDVSS